MLRIVCAAVKYLHDGSAGLVITGVHHWDDQMVNTVGYLPDCISPAFVDWREGFLDSEGNFVNRQEAWVIAYKAGQIINVAQGVTVGILMSHNLY